MATTWKYGYIIICNWVLYASCFQEQASSNLWGKKVDFLLQCRYWQLHHGLLIPELREFTLCVDLHRRISTQEWTVFMYKRHGDIQAELGLDGVGGKLRIWLFGREWPTQVRLAEDCWHFVCLMWSGWLHRLQLYVNSTVVLSTYFVERGRAQPRLLAPNGTLTLGMSHGFTNGEMVIEYGTSLGGSVSMFRMWGREHSWQHPSALRCAEGDVIRWNAVDWDMKECHTFHDSSLQCGDTFPGTPPVTMPSTSTTVASTNEQEPESSEAVSSVHPTVQESSTLLSTQMTSTGSPEPKSNSFFGVSLNVNISGTALDPEVVIQNWLNETLEQNQMFVLNLRMTSPRQLGWETLQVGEFSQTSSCAFQVQVAVSSNIAESESQIRDLLQLRCVTSLYGTLSPDPQSIQITLIEPGTCPEHSQQTQQGLYVWPQTDAQKKANLPCEGKPSHAATRFCVLDAVSERAKWIPPDLHHCPLIIAAISDLINISILPNNAMDIVEMIANLTRAQKALTLPELIIVITKLQEVITVTQVTLPLGTAIIKILSNIISSNGDLSAVTNSILNITESIGNNMIYSGEQYHVVTPILAISIVNVNSSRFECLSFGVSSVTQDSNPEIFLNQEPINSTVAFISLPKAVGQYFPDNNGVPPRVQFHFYGMSDLFTDKWSKKELNTYVVSASVTNATIKDLEHPIFVTLQHLKPILPNDKVQCVYWDFNKNDGHGGWAPSGCTENHTSSTHTTCFCDHLTHFGVLLDVTRTPVNEIDEKILTVISYLGCGVSSIFLGISVLTYAAFGRLRRDYPSKILLNLSLALLGLNLVFLVNSWLSSFGSRGLCMAVAVAQHYTLLASFTWMGLEALHMYFALVKVFNIYVPAYILKFCILGWGLPSVIISLVLAVKKDAYGSSVYRDYIQHLDGSEQLCWLQDDVVFYVSVVAYIVLILLCNVSVFVVVLVQLCNIQPPGSRAGLLHELRGITSLTVLLGLTWMVAFFTWGAAKVALLYVFAILNSLQGFFVFVFYCVMKETVRTQWRIHLCLGRFRLAEHSDWSQTVIGGVKSRLQQLIHTPSVKSAHSSSTNSSSGSTHCEQQRASIRRLAKGLAEKTVVLPRAQLCIASLPLPE